jgi:glycosyltransferase involved in cell wall biosynthesis
LRVGLDATPLLGTRTGIGNYVAGLLDGFAQVEGGPEIVLTPFTWRGVEGLPGGYARAPRRFSARALQECWTRMDWPPVEYLSGPVDVFHGTNFVLPPARRAAGGVSVHDLTYEHHADTVTDATLRYRTLVPRALKRGAVAVCLAETGAREVREHYRLPAERVMVAMPGVGGEWFAPPGPPPPSLPETYVLFVGSFEPRKNLPVLLDAMARLHADDPETPPLALVGPKGWGPALDASGLPKEAVVFPGFLDAEQLVNTVAGAAMLVLPSRYEGFGLPPVEAFATGTPVVASDIPVLREVLGDLATYATVGDADALAAAIAATLSAGDGGRAGRAARRAHARRYTWAGCARSTLAVYDRALALR